MDRQYLLLIGQVYDCDSFRCCSTCGPGSPRRPAAAAPRSSSAGPPWRPRINPSSSTRSPAGPPLTSCWSRSRAGGSPRRLRRSAFIFVAVYHVTIGSNWTWSLTEFWPLVIGGVLRTTRSSLSCNYADPLT